MNKIINKKIFIYWIVGIIICTITCWLATSFVLFKLHYIAIMTKFSQYLIIKLSLIAGLVGLIIGIVFGFIYIFKVWERNYENQAKLGYAKFSSNKQMSKYATIQ